MKIVTAMTSALAVAAASAYLFEPTPMAWAIAVRAIPSAGVSSKVEVVYGRALDSHHRAQAGVRISIDRRQGHLLIVLVSATSRPDGTFRIVSRLRTGTYTLVVSGKSGRKTIRSTDAVRLAPGHAFRVTVTLFRTGGLSVIPVRTY